MVKAVAPVHPSSLEANQNHAPGPLDCLYKSALSISRLKGNKNLGGKLCFLGTLTAYILVLVKFRQAIVLDVLIPLLRINIETVSNKIESALNWLILFSPKIGFLSDIVAIQSAIIAIAIPLSLDIVSRISERYQSGVITREFNKQWEIKALRILVIIDAISAITIKFFIADNPISGYWKFLAWATFLIFIATSVILLTFFDKLQKYTTDTKFLLDKLFQDMQNALKTITSEGEEIDNKLLVVKQKQFIDSLQGIGDILVFDTKNKKNDAYIKQGLSQLREGVKHFLGIQASQPKLFEQLLLSQDFFEISRQDNREAELRLIFFPEEYLISFNTIINQISRICEVALEIKNLEIARQAIYDLIGLLKDLCRNSNNSLLARQSISYLADFRKKIVNSELMYELTIEWYIGIVFDKSFHVSYLELFNRYFFLTIKEIIVKGETQLFQFIISRLIESNNIQKADYFSFGNISHLIHRYPNYSELVRDYDISRKLRRLSQNIPNIFTKEQLNCCLNSIDEIKEILPSSFNDLNQTIDTELSRLEEWSKSSLKFNRLIGLMFHIGAYCIFKERLDYVKYMWNYKQPSDSSVHDIIPKTVTGVVNLYFRFSSSLAWRGIVDWDDHHNSELHHRKYFLLLLIREFHKTETDHSLKFLDHLDSNGLNMRYNEVDELTAAASQLKQQINSSNIFNCSQGEFDSTIDNAVIPFLENWKPEIQQRLNDLIINSEISIEKVKNFDSEFSKSFRESILLREVFSHYALYTDRSTEVNDALTPFGIDILKDKAAFLEHWYAEYIDLGKIYGDNLARAEDAYILSKIVTACSTIRLDELKQILENLEGVEGWIILIWELLTDVFVGDSNFRTVDKAENLNLKNLIAFYNVKGVNIPIIEFYYSSSCEQNLIPSNAMVVLNTKKLCRLSQYNPEFNYSSDTILIEGCSISIRAYSQDEVLLNEILEHPPNWLLEKGNQQQQREFLQKHVYIRVHEKFGLDFHPEFQGYLVLLSQSDNHILDFMN